MEKIDNAFKKFSNGFDSFIISKKTLEKAYI